MKLKLPLIATALCLSYGINAQTGKVALKNNAAQIQNNDFQITKRTCGTPVPTAAWDSWFNQKVEEFKASMSTGKT